VEAWRGRQTRKAARSKLSMIDQWNALSIRIKSLLEAARMHAAFLGINKSDAYSTSVVLRTHVGTIFADTLAFASRFQSSLSERARGSVERAKPELIRLTSDETTTRDMIQQQAWAALVLLATFESEMSYIMADVQDALRLRSERAFAHLQRLIVVDGDFRRKWILAFNAGELECERHGAVHLLLHGIWAFKVSGAGAQTDLVFQDSRSGIPDPQRYADGLVLTEWKCAATLGGSTNQFAAARKQAERYKAGILAGTELSRYRFAVVVTKDYVHVPDDIKVDGTTFRHVNVAVEPSTPSRVPN
jgi:hypothetical protein